MANQLRVRIAAARRCIVRDADALPARGALAIELTIGEDGRPTAASVRHQGAPFGGAAGACLVAGYLRQLRFAPGPTVRIEVSLSWELPDRAAEASSTVAEADGARAEARAARERGRCIVRAASRIDAAASVLRTARGAARDRAREKLRLAREALAFCTRMEDLLRTAPSGVGGLVPSSAGLLHE